MHENTTHEGMSTQVHWDRVKVKILIHKPHFYVEQPDLQYNTQLDYGRKGKNKVGNSSKK